MSSLLTNVMAMSTLRLMAQTQRDLTQVQGQASSGLRVAAASDNAAYWSIGVAMNSQAGVLSAVKDGLALTGSIASVTTSALKAIASNVEAIRNDLVSAQQSGIDPHFIQADIAARQQQIITAANSAEFNGQNWLVGQQKTNETVTDLLTYDKSKATVDGILAKSVSDIFNATFTETSIFTETDNLGNTLSGQTITGSHSSHDTSNVVRNGQGHVISGSDITTSSTDTPIGTDVAALSIAPIPVLQSYSEEAGLSEFGFDAAPLRLFTVNTGQVVNSSTVQYADQTVVLENSVVQTSAAQSSYESALSSPSGIFDGALNLSNSSSKTTLLTMSTVAATSADLQTMLDAADRALTALNKASSTLGGLTNRIDGQTAFNASLSDAVTAGVGTLVDADMNIVSTRIQALQTQQQLQTQSLNIGNQNSQLILKLFAGS